MRKLFKILGIILAGILLCVMVLLLFPSNQYLRKALYHWTPNIDDYPIFENRIIRANNPQPWRLASGYNQGALSPEQLAYFEKLKTVAYVVVQDTAIIYEQYWKDYDNHTLSNSFSASKSIVSLLAGIARDEGKIRSFDQSTADYYPPFAADNRKNISIKDILTMSAGLDWNEAYGSPFSVTTKAYYGNDLQALVNNMKVAEPPGLTYRYQSGLTQLLSFIVADAVGVNISQYASEKLWTPIGAEQDALWCLDKKDGVEKAYCCFNASARDFARIGQLVLNRGKWNNIQVVSEEFLEEATTPATWLQDGDSGRTLSFYGYQWWRLDYKGLEVKYARGIYGQYIFILPEKNMVIVRLGHQRSKQRTAQGYPEDIDRWLEAALTLCP